MLPAQHPFDLHHGDADRIGMTDLDGKGPQPVGAELPVAGGEQGDQDLLIGIIEVVIKGDPLLLPGRVVLDRGVIVECSQP